MEPIPMCQWNKRLVALDAYVNGLRDTSKNNSDLLQRRAKTRTDLYNACRHDDHTDRFRACNAPVGTGKTTALMAHLLRVAKQRNLRHIIVVLPFTNIIRQSVQTYRTALRLPGETEEDMLAVVAEHHHQAEFASLGLRHLTTLWKAPIIVTTAVQFFETLAASKTSRLRKLHELPGSAVSLDEAHAAIPYALWPICWRWLRQWASDWNGHLVLASGSLPRFWEIDEFRSLTERKLIGTSPSRPSSNVCFLAQAQSDAAANLEKQRVTFSTIENPLSGEQLTQRVFEEIRSSGGPSLVIVNTVQSAAVLANMLRTKAEYPVLHISTALAPCHRALIVERVKAMLSYQKQWILVATSIVESGLDFSFSSAFRQRASVASILQVGGRVNRHGKERNSRVWDFDFAPDYQLPNNRQLQSSAEMLSRLFKDGWFAPDSPLDLKAICLYAMRAEFSATKQEKATQLVKLEDYCNYPAVSESCRVIDADTRTVIIDPELGKAVRLNLIGKGPPVSWRNLQLQSVQLYASKIDTLGIEPIANSNELFILPDSWSYDPDFLGYMAGALPLIHAKEEGFII